MTKDDPTMTSGINPESAFLGPKLWSRSIPVPITGDNEDFSVMNIDDFLSENGFDLNDPESPETIESPRSNSSDMETEEMLEEPVQKRSKKREVGGGKEPGNDFLYVESKRARLEREKEEKRKRSIAEIEFSPQELALATVPGVNFDPRNRRFAPDELRPQPIIRKRKKVINWFLLWFMIL